MNSKGFLLIAFILAALVQLYVPAKMIWDNEVVLEKGEEYKFRTAPIDPSDPFRGKYIILNYSDNSVRVSEEKDWTEGESLYAVLKKDNSGFAQIKSVSKVEPRESDSFIEVKVAYVSGDGSNELTIDYPFDRFYMEESKAYDAEQAYRQSQLDSSKVTYALVGVQKGRAVLKDVLIDGVSIREIVIANQQREKG